MIAFVQPFSLRAAGGGARILRALSANAPARVVSVCTSASPPSGDVLTKLDLPPEIHLPARPHFGFLEGTRLAPRLHVVDRPLASRFRRRLKEFFIAEKIESVHSVAHEADFHDVFRVAQSMGLPYHLSVHDDLAYCLRGRPDLQRSIDAFAEVWAAAAHRFVISDEMGAAYAERFGDLPFSVVTDGLERLAPAQLERPRRSLRVYFMGLFHLSYAENFRSLVRALDEIRRHHPDHTVSLTCRCGGLPADLAAANGRVQALPFGSEADVERDMTEADLLYLPLPFDPAETLFTRFSLSTKMITYLGSGLPILFHGPADSAAGRLLGRNNAAVMLDSLDPSAIVDRLRVASLGAADVVKRALALAASRFMLSEQRERFWSQMSMGCAV